jgi:hypothetical protein
MHTPRKLTDHIVPGAAGEVIEIFVIDPPGAGGASHLYNIAFNLSVPTPPPTLSIKFQQGAITESGINGITNEALIAILIDRMRGFQSGPFTCRENALALTKLEEALFWLQARTRARLARQVEGTHAI